LPDDNGSGHDAIKWLR